MTNEQDMDDEDELQLPTKYSDEIAFFFAEHTGSDHEADQNMKKSHYDWTIAFVSISLSELIERETLEDRTKIINEKIKNK